MDTPVQTSREREGVRGSDRGSVAASEFEDFVAARSTQLLRTAYLLTRDHGRAEDLLQTALAKAWLSWRRIQTTPDAYVRKVMVNTYATWWRRKWNDERPSSELPEPAHEEADGWMRHDLWTALGHLPRGQRAVIVLRFFEDLTEAETARVLECSIGTVKSQTARALTRLRIDAVLLEGEGEER